MKPRREGEIAPWWDFRFRITKAALKHSISLRHQQYLVAHPWDKMTCFKTNFEVKAHLSSESAVVHLTSKVQEVEMCVSWRADALVSKRPIILHACCG